MHIYSKIVGDLFHGGHVAFLRAARGLGERLTVCVVPDERVAAGKGRRPVMTTAERVAVVSACRHVDAVITDGPKVISRAFMQQHGYDLYAFGACDEAELRTKLADCPDLPEPMRQRLPYTEGISSTELIERIRRRLAEGA